MTTRPTWITRLEELVLSTPILKVFRKDCVASDDQRPFSFYVTRSPDWCNIIPITEEGKLVLVDQYRIGTDSYLEEWPGGVIESNEKSEISQAALRELKEETGYELVPGGRIEHLGWTFPNPAIQGNKCHSYLVGPVRKVAGQNLDSGEMLEVLEIAPEELAERALNGNFKHALMLVGLVLFLFKSKNLTQHLTEELKSWPNANASKKS